MDGDTRKLAAAFAIILGLPVPPPMRAAPPDTRIRRKDTFDNPTRLLRC